VRGVTPRPERSSLSVLGRDDPVREDEEESGRDDGRPDEDCGRDDEGDPGRDEGRPDEDCGREFLSERSITSSFH
jgi:hypothetical protein